MGATFSKSNAVWLQTDKAAYQDGDHVQGVVCLNVMNPMKVTSIDCQLLGVEQTYWTETREHGSGSKKWTSTETRGGKVEIFSVMHDLTNRPLELLPGQYEWPIVFALPEGLPSTFKVGSGADGAEVNYHVNLVFHTPGFFTKNIRGSFPLVVHQRMKAPPVSVDQSADLQLVSCCCFKRGWVKAHIRLDWDVCQPGEEVGVLLELENKSGLAIKAVQLSLKQEVSGWERPGGGGHSTRWYKEFAKTMHGGVQPYTTLQGGMARRMQLQLPTKLPPSMRGALIACTHYVKVKLIIGSCVKDVRLKVPLLIVAPQPQPTAEEPFYSEPPPFWSPAIVAAPQGIDVPSAPALPAELLSADAPFWARTMSNSSEHGGQAAVAAAPEAASGSKYAVV